MCENPGRLPDGTEFACRKCWQCCERRIDDWVGRCLAETKSAVASHSITLTYGRDEHDGTDHLRAAWLTYSDVQKYFKLLRRHGYKFRYLVAGEYGSTKGRAHWHMLMFWYQNNRDDGAVVPPHELTTTVAKRFHNEYWPHGFQHWEAPTRRSIRYVCKYIQKDVGKDERQANLHMSKKPPLGDAFFKQLAAKYVEQGLAPQSLKYTFADVLDPKTGRRREYYMRETTARNFIEEYKRLWKLHRGGHHPWSEVIAEHDDKTARQVVDPDWQPDRRPKKLPPAAECHGPYSAIDPQTGKRGLLSIAYRNGRGYWYRYRPMNKAGWSDYEWQRETDAEMSERIAMRKKYLAERSARTRPAGRGAP